MDLRAKQRITGAVILVALIVLLVPPMLTGPREVPPADESRNDGLREYTIDMDEQNRRAQPGSPVADNPAAAPVPPPAPDTRGERAVPGETAAPEISPAPAPVAAMGTAATPAPAPATTPATPPATAQRSETPRAVAASPPPAPGSFVVQLGTFADRQNAERLARDMTAKGFAAFVAPITNNGRELYRVRVGPARDRASAEALAAQLKRMGQSGSIMPIS